jgi:hypothetical protein
VKIPYSLSIIVRGTAGLLKIYFMRTMKSEQETATPNLAKRKLKIQGRSRRDENWKLIETPEIRLCGRWLHKAGFSEGQVVTVIPTPGKLIIQVAEE